MSYKPDEGTWMAYVYGELEGQEKEKFEQYLIQNPAAQKELEKFQGLRKVLANVADKEVIAPPIVIGESKQRFLWNAPYLKTIISVAASLLLIMLAGKLTDARVNYTNRELRISFGEVKTIEAVKQPAANTLSAAEVQSMINESLTENNTALQTSWQQSQQKLDASIKKNLIANSGKIDKLVRDASLASQEQIAAYASTLQSENSKLVKDYFQLTSTDQKKYMEDLLVDFAKYLQQQRSNDLQLVQTRLNSLEKNTDMFKQETEQILSSIITNSSATTSRGTKN